MINNSDKLNNSKSNAKKLPKSYKLIMWLTISEDSVSFVMVPLCSLLPQTSKDISDLNQILSIECKLVLKNGNKNFKKILILTNQLYYRGLKTDHITWMKKRLSTLIYVLIHFISKMKPPI